MEQRVPFVVSTEVFGFRVVSIETLDEVKACYPAEIALSLSCGACGVLALSLSFGACGVQFVIEVTELVLGYGLFEAQDEIYEVADLPVGQCRDGLRIEGSWFRIRQEPRVDAILKYPGERQAEIIWMGVGESSRIDWFKIAVKEASRFALCLTSASWSVEEFKEASTTKAIMLVKDAELIFQGMTYGDVSEIMKERGG